MTDRGRIFRCSDALTGEPVAYQRFWDCGQPETVDQLLTDDSNMVNLAEWYGEMTRLYKRPLTLVETDSFWT